MMNWWQAALLGVIQGLTEFLPISSSGHLVLVEHYLGISDSSVFFEVFLHVMTLSVVIVYFRKHLWPMPFTLARNIIVASIPIGIVGIVWGSEISALFDSVILVSVILLITGAINLASDYILERRKSEVAEKPMSALQAFIIGVAQMGAVLPGLSRSGSTLFAGLAQKINRQQVFVFSFLISIPVIVGAMLVQLIDTGFTVPSHLNSVHFIAGGIGAVLSGWLSLVVLEKVIKQAELQWFSWYCFVVGGLSLLIQWQSW